MVLPGIGIQETVSQTRLRNSEKEEAMNAIRKSITALTLVAGVAGAAGSTLPASAHPGHAAPIITIDRPAAGGMYVNDVQQGGSVQQVGNLINPAVSIGKSLTITVSWKCPDRSTGARVLVEVRDSNNAVVHGGGLLFAGATGAHSSTWPHGTSGTYRIVAQVTCTHMEQGPGGPVPVVDGADGDMRDVIVIAE